MSDPQNNFLIFNENNNQGTTLSQGDYLALAYRISGLIPMIADPIAHNKMYRQWSLMCNAIGAMINDKNLDALDTNSSDLKNNLKSTVKGLARDELSTEITTLGNIDTWKESITATPAEINTLDGITASTAELNILDGVTASTTELNYSTGLTGNIQQQINAITGVISSPFPIWKVSTAYAVGDICIASNFNSYKYLECVVAGTSGTTMPANANIGTLVTDNEIKWLVCDWRDSNPVGTIKQDLVVRDGYVLLNGQALNTADYPRLVKFLEDNNLILNYNDNYEVNLDFYYANPEKSVFLIPNFLNKFIENYSTALNKKDAGLPNIEGVVSSLMGTDAADTSTGAFNWNQTTQYWMEAKENANNKGNANLHFSASNSNSIYGNSNTVQPPAITLIPIIKY